MKNHRILVTAIAVSLFVVSCSTMYIRPAIEPVIFKQAIPGGASLIFKTALKLLPMLGYKIQGSDPSAGTITTAPYAMKIDPSQCDCGSAMGLPIIKSGGIKAKVYFILAVTDNEMMVKADIQPELDDIMSTLAAAGITYTCVSKGALEQVFARQFVEGMKAKALQLMFGR